MKKQSLVLVVIAAIVVIAGIFFITNQNIQKDGNYPHMFIYSNLNDTFVPYTEPYMYYKSLKENVDVFQKNQKHFRKL